jgi:DNA-binding beta-propeller fold protein YncE
MTIKLKALALAGTILAAPLFASAASAASIIGLVDGKTIVIIDPATRKVTAEASVKGGPLLGFDMRPADGALYGILADGSIVMVDPKTGQTTAKSKLSEPFKAGTDVTFDFNPAADRLRLMNSDGTSLRINVDDGKVTVDGSHKFKDGDANAGKTPKVVAGAYSNSLNPKPAATALYNIDATTWSLVTQAPPNDGVLNTVGPLGITAAAPIAFNIVASAGDKNDAWLATGGNLYAVDLKTGKATLAGKLEGLKGKLTDIAWVD